ncbi:hypothetical protein EDD16DRAFT_119289 [Pisolithus croceorrhizus]|nr:hypothetical protein EDD16DRAFT_119289 [Pisolithus croceorrhizus]KAI6167788.1 hypothetical protein EDD17DRAFT_862466 [Pisolithus thermaeus]
MVLVKTLVGRPEVTFWRATGTSNTASCCTVQSLRFLILFFIFIFSFLFTNKQRQRGMVDKRQGQNLGLSGCGSGSAGLFPFYIFLIGVGSNRAYNEGEDHSLYILESSQVVHHCLVDSLAGLCFAEDLLAKTVFSFPLSSYLRVFSYTYSFFPDTPTTSSLHFSFKY